jgi:DNA-binding cell septation regulator SpoVG
VVEGARVIAGLKRGCKHAVPCVHHKRIEFKDVCHTCYSVETLRKAYSIDVHSLFEVDLDPKERDVVIPPNLKRCIGRLRRIEEGKIEMISLVW